MPEYLIRWLYLLVREKKAANTNLFSYQSDRRTKGYASVQRNGGVL